MSLGCLATIATVAPRNLTLIIWDNGIYQITGKQVTAASRLTDTVAVARGAGIANSSWIRDEAHFEELLGRGFDTGGPVLLAAKIDDKPGEIRPPRDPALVRNRVMKGLGNTGAAVLD
jgi:thiamine pyrophosphate-dependent acetolactate synthase large subunit-like protein